MQPKTKTKMDIRRKIARRVLRELQGRKGFGDWWYNVDIGIQDEIFDAIANIIPEQKDFYHALLLRNKQALDFLIEKEGLNRELAESIAPLTSHNLHTKTALGIAELMTCFAKAQNKMLQKEALLAAICDYNKYDAQRDILDVEAWLEDWYHKQNP